MIRFLTLLALTALLFSCSEPTRIVLSDANDDSVAHLAPDPEIMGNTEIFFIPGTIQGSAIWVINGPSANVGIDLRDRDNTAFIYYADSYVGKSANVAQTGTQIPWNRWMRARLVVYESGLSGWIVSALEALGMDFFDSLEDYMIEQVYETDIYLQADGKRMSTPVRQVR